MAPNSPNSNNFNTTLSPPNLTIPNEALVGKGTGQLGLSQRVTEWRKTSLVAKNSRWVHGRVDATEDACLTPTSLEEGHDHDADSIIRASQMVRAQLMHVASSSFSNEIVVETEEKKKAWEMLQAQILRASALVPKNEVVGGTSDSTSSLDMVMSTTLTIAPPVQNRFFSQLEPNTNNMGIIAFCPSPSSALQRVGEPANEVDNVCENGKARRYDGRIHSYPYKKNGPYTCPKCDTVFYTSQKFAAHVSSNHYKYETKSERKQRLLAKVRGRNLRLQQVNDALTMVPINAVSARNHNNNNIVVTPSPPRVIKAEVISEFGAEIPPPPGMDKINGVKIKLEPVDT
ncbi:uncharacterized protein LOC109813600 [Cajanus cajan]|uniref:C2H2-type domain-containing protein n=1 Tax=Cajanus cajan TaxID=3821 RepID=A0A151U7Z7_CAJCA|nr:uncharacterized protein LOC109813600 [Cajanus cajan]KYP75407.1 hypothetical protein KK1_008135 [Cajanus cajan]